MNTANSSASTAPFVIRRSGEHDSARQVDDVTHRRRKGCELEVPGEVVDRAYQPREEVLGQEDEVEDLVGGSRVAHRVEQQQSESAAHEARKQRDRNQQQQGGGGERDAEHGGE